MKFFIYTLTLIFSLNISAANNEYIEKALKTIKQLEPNSIDTKIKEQIYTNNFYTYKQDKKKALIIIAGVAEPIIKYWPFFDLLKDNYDFYFYDLVNQGNSPDSVNGIDHRKVHLDNFSVYQDTFSHFLKSIRSNYQSIDLISHSTGSHIVLKHLLNEQESINKFIAITPMVDVKLDYLPYSLVKMYLKWFYKPTDWAPKQNSKNPDFSYFTSSKQNFDNYQKLIYDHYPKLLSTGVTAGWLLAALDSVINMKSTDFSEIKNKILFLTAGKDKIVRTKTSNKICKKSLPNCQLIEYKGGRHQLHLEKDEILLDMYKQIKIFLNN